MSTQIDINPVAGVRRQAQFGPGAPALVYEGRTIGYAELVDDAGRLAAAMRANGVVEGDRVAYLGLNSATFLTTMLATWWLGGVFEPLNFRLAPREVGVLLERSTPRLVVTEPCHQDVVETLAGHEGFDAGAYRLVLVDNDPAVPVAIEPAAFWTPLSGFLATAGGELPEARARFEDDLAILMFTSGTTGVPKGVQLTFGNLWWNSVNVDSLVDTRRGDTNLAVAPLFHIGGLNALTLRVLVRGGTTVVRRTFDPRQTLRDIEEHRVSQAFLVPAQLSAMQQTDEFERHDLSSLRALICAGAPVPPVLLKQYEHKGVPVQQAWGLTETSPFATYLPSELTYEKAGSCGIPMPYTQVKIVDPATGEDVAAPGTTGEMWVKGPNVTPGYWKDPAMTAVSFLGGWFRTGDIGFRDEDGFFYIVDRLKDMIITGGENVYPAEVERALMEFPGVLDVAVVGVEDSRWGESVVAVMSCANGTVPDIEEVRNFTSTYLARYKLPKKLVLTGAVPRNGAGKLDKPAIRKMVAEEGRDVR
ncbi:acyl-CoA synthetase [Arthrobacter halodurans]|uniref:Long-chain fatty acid--CoA ligase n=1 Tax=Arthrobacter halodurans TaxID=516699 RepID=A0ABV4UHR7_9MICC